MSYTVERAAEIAEDANPVPLQKRSFRLPFNGTLSADEMRMLNQGLAATGANYEELLQDWEDAEHAREIRELLAAGDDL